MFWRGGDGKPYRTFTAVAAYLDRRGKSLRFAMNGGMYQGDFRQVGLYIWTRTDPSQHRQIQRRARPNTELL